MHIQGNTIITEENYLIFSWLHKIIIMITFNGNRKFKSYNLNISAEYKRKNKESNVS